MEDLKSKVSNLTDSFSEYVQTNYKLTLLNATDKATGIAASTLATVVVLLLGVFVLFFGGIALAIWLGYLLNNVALGYLLVAGFFVLIIILLVALRKKIIFPMIRNQIINKIYEQHDQNI